MDASVFSPFDYVALGHLHGAQRAGGDGIRYAGSPLKYSISERNQNKSVTLVDLADKGTVNVQLIPLQPKRDVCQFCGTFEDLMARQEACEDYCEIILTDEQDIPNAMNRLRALYPNLMHMAYDNTRTRSQTSVLGACAPLAQPIELFEELYEAQNGQSMNDEQRAYMRELIAEIWEGEQ